MYQKKFIRNLSTIIILILLLCVCFSVSSYADTAGGPAFVIDPVYPENQRVENGYFDLRVTPGQEQELVLTVRNDSDKEIELEIEAVNASTAADGFIDYTTANIQDETMKFPFAQMAEIQEPSVTVPARGTGEVKVDVKVPEEPFEGMVLGGIRVLKVVDETSDQLITNAYQYAFAVVLTESDQEIRPDFEFVNVTSGLENYRAAVTANIRNTASSAAKNVQVTTELHMEGKDEPVYSLKKTVDIAPNSVWNCTLADQAGYGFQAGDYILNMTMELDGKYWAFDETFTIAAEQAEYMNDNAVNQQQMMDSKQFPVWAISLLVLGAVIALLIVILIFRSKKAAED